MVVKTFRGLLADDGQDRIRLQTIKGKVGYRIVKFQLMPYQGGAVNQESTVKIYRKEQGTIDGLVDFTNQDLLGAGYFENTSGANYIGVPLVVIFDNTLFNQDIYVTHHDTGGGTCNYYLELEVIPLGDAGAEYTTLKDMRSA